MSIPTVTSVKKLIKPKKQKREKTNKNKIQQKTQNKNKENNKIITKTTPITGHCVCRRRGMLWYDVCKS